MTPVPTIPCDRCGADLTVTDAGEFAPHPCVTQRDRAFRSLDALASHINAVRNLMLASTTHEQSPQWGRAHRLLTDAAGEIERAAQALSHGRCECPQGQRLPWCHASHEVTP